MILKKYYENGASEENLREVPGEILGNNLEKYVYEFENNFLDKSLLNSLN